MSTCVTFLNLGPGSWDLKHPIWKNYETQFPINQILNDEIEKKIQNDSKQKKSQLKEQGSKLKYKINFIYDWRVKLKRKINLAKWPKNNEKNKYQNWHKKYKNYWRVKLKRKITLTKEKKKNKDQICKNNIP